MLPLHPTRQQQDAYLVYAAKESKSLAADGMLRSRVGSAHRCFTGCCGPHEEAAAACGRVFTIETSQAD